MLTSDSRDPAAKAASTDRVGSTHSDPRTYSDSASRRIISSPPARRCLPARQHSRGLVSTKGPGIRSGRAGGTACGDAFIFQAGARLVSAYLLDGCLGKQAAQPGGHRAVGELPEAGSVVTDHHGDCARAREMSASAGSESGRGLLTEAPAQGPRHGHLEWTPISAGQTRITTRDAGEERCRRLFTLCTPLHTVIRNGIHSCNVEDLAQLMIQLTGLPRSSAPVASARSRTGRRGAPPR